MEVTKAYEQWVEDPSPENMANILDKLDPTINSEVQRYTGPKPLLRSKARGLTVQAIKQYDPTRGTHLRTWVVTQLQPLSRYGKQLKPVRSGEIATRQAAEIAKHHRNWELQHGRAPTDEELADIVGISKKRVQQLRTRVAPVVNESQLLDGDAEDTSLPATMQSSGLDFASEAVYKGLSNRDKLIYDWKTGAHGKPMLSNQEIAKRLGITPAAISQTTANIANSIKSVVY